MEIFLLRVEGKMFEFWKLFARHPLCSNYTSLIYFIHTNAFVLSVLFLPEIYCHSLIYLIHPNFASFFQNNCILLRVFEILNCKRSHMSSFWNLNMAIEIKWLMYWRNSKNVAFFQWLWNNANVIKFL